MPEQLFYDGSCGLCHRFVRFVLSRDRGGDLFRFAPIGGETFRRLVPKEVRATLPDSIVVRDERGALLIKSAAVLHIASRLGGIWRVLAGVSRIVPRPLRDLVYDGVARIRKKIFKAPPAACPLVPPELRARFDD